MSTHPALRPTSSIRWRRSTSTPRFPKKGDQRQMEPWQRIGTYAAGLALDSAGVKGNAEILGRMDMIVAAGGGERDQAVDGAILTGLAKSGNRRPLSQRAADERPASDPVPGAAFQSPGRQYLDRARRHRLLAHIHGRGIRRRRRGAHRARPHRRGPERNRACRRRPERRAQGDADALRVRRLQREGRVPPVWERAAHPGFALGSMGAFLVLESAAHAQARRRPAAGAARRRRQCPLRSRAGRRHGNTRRLWRSSRP